jgi:hypothetical protein
MRQRVRSSLSHLYLTKAFMSVGRYPIVGRAGWQSHAEEG